MRPLRICFVVPSLHVGGMEHFVVQLATALTVRGHVAHVICTSYEGELAAGLRSRGVGVEVCRARGPWELLVPIGLMQRLRAFRADVVHSQSGSWLPAAFAGRLAGVRAICHTEHGLTADPEPLKLRITKWLAARATNAIVAVSEPLRAAVAGQLHVPLERLVHVDNGIPLQAYQPQPGAREAVRAMLGIAPEAKLVGVVARLDPLKGVDVLLEALRGAEGVLPPCEVVVVGDGPQRAMLEALVPQLPVTVRLLGTRHDVPTLLQAFDLFVLPSRSEALPLAVLEAMASGCCVLASAVGQVPVLLRGGAGVTVPPEQPETLLSAIATLLNDDAARARSGELAKQRVAAEYGHEAMTNRYLSLYEQGAT